MIKTILAVTISSLALWQSAEAQELIERYRTMLGPRDHVNSSGERLSSAAAILRQDRANYHRFGVKDEADEGDRFFAQAENRDRFESLLRGAIDPRLAERILRGMPKVEVSVYQAARGPYVIVTEVQDQPANKPAIANSQTDQPSSPKESGGSGSGFFVSAKGHVLTNLHVVKDCNSVSVQSGMDQNAAGRVIAVDARGDLALVATQLVPQEVPTFNLKPAVGETLYVYGFPLGGLLSSSGNFTSGMVTAVSGIGDDSSVFQMSAPVQPGSSGGPVVDDIGNIVGVVVSKLDAVRVAKITQDIPQNINFAIKSTVAATFLESHGLAPNAAKSQESITKSSRSIAADMRSFTVRVLCN